MTGAKDDRLDAFGLAASLGTDTRLYRKIAQLPVESIELRRWSRIHDGLQSERSAINQMRAQLARYLPTSASRTETLPFARRPTACCHTSARYGQLPTEHD